MPNGYVTSSDDCDDHNPLAFDPDAAEICDGMDNSVELFIPQYGASVMVSSGHSYVMPGAHLQHATTYTPIEGVTRYSIVCFFKLKGSLNHVSVSDIIAEYYK